MCLAGANELVSLISHRHQVASGLYRLAQAICIQLSLVRLIRAKLACTRGSPKKQEPTMNRTRIMTAGFVLIMLGIQLNLVRSYELTPRFTNFLSENGNGLVTSTDPTNMIGQSNQFGQPNQFSLPNQSTVVNQQFNSPYYQASYPAGAPLLASQNPSVARFVTPPTWLCWPVLFLGAVVFLHGFGKRTD